MENRLRFGASTLALGLAFFAADATIAPAPASACQCSAQIAQAQSQTTAAVNANTNSVVSAMQLAISEAIAKSTTQLSGVLRQTAVANERITDSNAQMARQRAENQERARIRDDQKITPEQAQQYCATLQAGNQAGQGAAAVAAMASDMQRRGEERNAVSSVRSSARQTLETTYASYCDATAARAGVCTAAPPAMQNADISARNLLNGPTLTNSPGGASIVAVAELPHTPTSVEAAIRFCETVARPVVENITAPPPPNADPAIVAAYLRERNMSARANLVQQFCTSLTAARTATISATPDQQRMLQEQYSTLPASERPPIDRLSYNQVVSLEVDQRFGRGAVAWGERMARNKSSPDMLYEQNLQLAVHGRILLDIQRTLERGFAMLMPVAAVESATPIAKQQ
ncbi:MAG: hypothetical protein ING19_07310 [Azospirillum sp.]|nr:hypothetical protein [Azospirillum sp.]